MQEFVFSSLTMSKLLGTHCAITEKNEHEIYSLISFYIDPIRAENNVVPYIAIDPCGFGSCSKHPKISSQLLPNPHYSLPNLLSIESKETSIDISNNIDNGRLLLGELGSIWGNTRSPLSISHGLSN